MSQIVEKKVPYIAVQKSLKSCMQNDFQKLISSFLTTDTSVLVCGKVLNPNIVFV